MRFFWVLALCAGVCAGQTNTVDGTGAGAGRAKEGTGAGIAYTVIGGWLPSTCGPPNYSCFSQSTANYTGYQTDLTPIFTSSSLINDTNVDVTLNPLYGCYTVITTTGVGNVTQSGGSQNIEVSAKGTYFYLAMQGGIGTIYHTTQVASTPNCPN